MPRHWARTLRRAEVFFGDGIGCLDCRWEKNEWQFTIYATVKVRPIFDKTDELKRSVILQLLILAL